MRGRRGPALLLGYSLAALLILAIIAALLGVAGLFASPSGQTTGVGLRGAEAARSIRVEHFAGDLILGQGDFRLESQDMPPDFSCFMQGDVLVLDGGSRADSWLGRLFEARHPTVWLTLPAGLALEDVEIAIQAGDLAIGALDTRRFTLEAGVGDVSIQSLTAAESCKIEGGVGDLELYGGALTGLELSTGLGDLSCTARLLGDCSISGGLGDTEITVLGPRSDYRLACSGGLGDVEIDGVEVHGALENDDAAPHSIRISVGMGDIDVEFRGQ